jgi:hypothetical protein
MGLSGGKTIRLTPLRRMMCDFLEFSRKVPLVAIERRLRLGELLDARRTSAHRPSWFALFLKAYALVAERKDVLRQSFLSFPRPRLHQHPCNVASLAVARPVGGEEGVLMLQVRRPERLTLVEIDERIRRARTEPVENFGTFRRQLRVARLPRPLRRLSWWAGLNVSGGWRARYAGTFGVTGVAALGSASLHTLSPLTTTLTYGVFEADGTVPVRLFYDHRVLDGVAPAEALRELEEALLGPILAELRGGTSPSLAA